MLWFYYNPSSPKTKDHLNQQARPPGPCTRAFTTTWGLPCTYKIKEYKVLGQQLQISDFHPHWYYNRFSSPLQPPILEPLQIISKRAANTALNSTKQLPSGFEATENRKRRCGLCKNPGHNRNSHRCPKRLQQLIQDAEAGSASTSVYTTTTVQTEVLTQVSQSQEHQPGQEHQVQDTKVASQSVPDTSVCTTIIVQTEVPVQAPAQLPPLPIEPD